MREAIYKFRPGALDAIARAKNTRTEPELAWLLGLQGDTNLLGKLRHGALVGAPMALHVSGLMGDEEYVSAWFEQVGEELAAA